MLKNNGEKVKNPINLELNYQIPKLGKKTIIYYQQKYYLKKLIKRKE